MSEKIINLNKENFDTEVGDSSTPLLVDFWAPWCGPCRMIAPELDALAGEIKGKARIGKVNVDENGELAEKFGIQSIPTLIVFKEGKEAQRLVGLQKRTHLQQALGV